MSDCSMAAMKPKMPPKTCGTCDSFVLAKGCDHLGICSEVYFEDEYGNDAFAAVRDTRACDNPSLYKPRMVDCESCPERIPEDACRVKARCYDLEQRCRQLEQAARDMCRDFKQAERLVFSGFTSAALNLISEASKDYQHDLEALGVSVDG